MPPELSALGKAKLYAAWAKQITLAAGGALLMLAFAACQYRRNEQAPTFRGFASGNAGVIFAAVFACGTAFWKVCIQQ